MARKFSFDNALLHFARTEGPPGFIWKYMLTYLLAWVAYFALYIYFMWPLLSLYGTMMQDIIAGGTGDPELFARQISEQMMGMLGGLLILLPLALVLWSVFEAAIQRRYIRDEGFGLRFSGDELRMMAVGLLWLLFIIAAYLVLVSLVAAMSAGVAVAAGSQGVAIAAVFVFGLAGLCVWLWLSVRLSAAGALTIRDRRIRFFDSWAVTKGRFWPMFGAFLLLYIGYMVAFFVAYMISGMGMFGVMMSNPEVMDAAANDNPEAMLALIVSPAMLVPLGISYAVMMVFYALFQFAWGGPAALAARTDPRTGGMPNVEEEFA